jgi:hypothetical protein
MIPLKNFKVQGVALIAVFMFIIFMPLRYVYNVYEYSAYTAMFGEVYMPGWQIVFPFILIIKLLIMLYGVFAGYSLLKLNQKAIIHTKRYLLIKFTFSLIEVLVLIAPKEQYASQIFHSTRLSLIPSFVYFLFFWFYFTKSNYVRSVFKFSKK